MMTIHRNRTHAPRIAIEPIEADGILDRLAAFHCDVLDKKARFALGGGLGFQRVAFFFHGEGAGRDGIQHFTASPRVGEGDMIGCLLFKDEALFFGHLEKRLGQTLHSISGFEDRSPGVSRHLRASAPALRLHHMIMVC
uniref:Uncharacterized protein n=1 Tax=Candidatus Kentrum sp. TC TaxID=2126339 RepID=A0A450ZJ73_9GAMM|nr:MAG: hypothetical protein BECKTC1821F_GA0114240_100387 [Candidatus Kentron sp. TC]